MRSKGSEEDFRHGGRYCNEMEEIQMKESSENIITERTPWHQLKKVQVNKSVCSNREVIDIKGLRSGSVILKKD